MSYGPFGTNNPKVDAWSVAAWAWLASGPLGYFLLLDVISFLKVNGYLASSHRSYIVDERSTFYFKLVLLIFIFCYFLLGIGYISWSLFCFIRNRK